MSNLENEPRELERVVPMVMINLQLDLELAGDRTLIECLDFLNYKSEKKKKNI